MVGGGGGGGTVGLTAIAAAVFLLVYLGVATIIIWIILFLFTAVEGVVWNQPVLRVLFRISLQALQFFQIVIG